MPGKGWPFTKPVGAALALAPRVLTDDYQRLEIKAALANQGTRFNFKLNQSADLLVKITSNIATSKNWYRAGYLANFLTGGPISNPVRDVKKIYFGQQHLLVAYTGLDHYFEFWPHVWITDYRIEIWAKLPIFFVISNSVDNEGLLFFNAGDGEITEFTFFGDLIIFP